MDLFEKFNRSFGSWYEGLFGGGDDVRPKDILRRILAAMEDHRKEGFDNRIYVPNQYVLEINVHDEEEREYLLSFLDRDELEAAIRRYCQQNHYHIRGALDFTIKEAEEGDPVSGRGEKFRVRCRYSSRVTAPETAALPRADARLDLEERTVASVAFGHAGEESGTVPAVTSAAVVIYAPDRPPFRYTLTQAAISIGRSPRSGNDLVIESDGQISKRHARIEMDPDGRFTIYDMGSTNGTKVNGRRVENRTLNDGDEIAVGATRMTFQQAITPSLPAREQEPDVMAARSQGIGRSMGAFGGAAAALNEREGSSGPLPPTRALRSRVTRLVLLDRGQEVDDFLLASETSIGRGVTNDIVLPDRTIATRHARIVNDGDSYILEPLDGEAGTTLNGADLTGHRPEPLHSGDLIGLGALILRFESGT